MSEEKVLKGKFVKVAKADGSQDFDESFWEIWDGDYLLFKKSVKELCNEIRWLDYEIIYSPEFGKLLLKRAKKLKAFW